MPTMIVRLILSLKKAAGPVPSSAGQLETAGFARRVFSGTECVRGDDMALMDLSSGGTSGLSQSNNQI
jgi:hypothetical protein